MLLKDREKDVLLKTENSMDEKLTLSEALSSGDIGGKKTAGQSFWYSGTLAFIPTSPTPTIPGTGKEKISTCAQDKTQELPLAQQVTVGKVGSHVVT